MSDNLNVSRPHTSDIGGVPTRHVDIDKPPNELQVPVQDDLGATAISGAQYGPYKEHPHGH